MYEKEIEKSFGSYLNILSVHEMLFVVVSTVTFDQKEDKNKKKYSFLPHYVLAQSYCE